MSPPATVERSHPFRDWAARQGLRLLKARAAREAKAFDDDPRLSVRWPWRRETPPGNQTLRAFIQINVLPRPR
jgi:hypothetical protein